MNEINDLIRLSNELTYHRYLLNQGQARRLFKGITIPEYIALQSISRSIHEKGAGAGRAYLKDIAEELCLSIAQTSKMMRKLRDKGLVLWAHDGNGSEGTYIAITESGIELMKRQETLLKDYYGRVTESFGEKNMMALLRLMEQLEAVMEAELNSGGGKTNGI